MSIVSIGLIIDVVIMFLSLITLHRIYGSQKDKIFLWYWGIAIALCTLTIELCVPKEKDVENGKAVYVNETHTVDGDTICSKQYIMWKRDLKRR